MNGLQHPEAIRHFQSLCDACQSLADRYHGPSELRLYADGYLHALRRSALLDPLAQRRLEEVVDRWIMEDIVGILSQLLHASHWTQET